MSTLTGLKNIGSTLAHRLQAIGVTSKQDLQALGAAAAYQRMQSRYPEARLPLCYYLYSLEGALHNRDWRSFTEQEKAAMRTEAGVQ